MPQWLEDAVFYEIYPQSFMDSNKDGIGDFQGIIDKLDYIRELGCNALWLNPCFDSPFKDAGYDVRDYKKTADRYGTNDDLSRLFEEAHRRGIRVLLDLVPGHTSEEHKWFIQSGRAEENPYSNRYIWTDHCFAGAAGLPFISGECPRNGAYVLNFFKCQPALNYGFLHPEESWQLPADHPDCIATREAMKDVMRFWLAKGCDGFRVDMAASLVKKDDELKTGTSAIWRDIRRMLDEEYPEAAMVSEWGTPELALKAGFHMDFYLNWKGNGYSTLMRDYENGEDHSFFKKDAGGDILRFLDDYLPQYEKSKEDGYFCLITCNHDTIRPRYNLNPEELKLAFAFLFTMPGVPFLYYGDEIGMRYLNLPTKEGGYFRTGSRTPMQWNEEANFGFSKAEEEKLYLPQDLYSGAPTVEDGEKDPASLLNTVKAILALRHSQPQLQASANLEIVYAREQDPLFVYKRGSLLLAVNPSGAERSATLACLNGDKKTLFCLGRGRIEKEALVMEPQSFLVLC